jgi:transketolase
MAEYEGMCYMRTLRAETEILYSDDHIFNLGGFEVLHEGRDVLLAATGYMVHEGNKAVELLDKAGVSATLVDLYSIPFDQDKLLDLVAANGGFVVSLEDNYGGSLGSAIADALVELGRRLRRWPRCMSTESPRAPDARGDAPDVRPDRPGHREATMKMLQVV